MAAKQKPEKVEIIEAESWTGAGISGLEKDYSEWAKINHGKIEILDRQFRLAAATGSEVCTIAAIAVFYREK